MLANAASAEDDRLTVISVSALACILQDVLHEGLGHGVTAWLSGAHRVTMSTVALQSDIDTRCLVLAMAGTLFTGTSYFFFSGVLNFGDWAAVIRGLQPHWIWRLGLTVVGVTSYYSSLLLVAAKLKPFHNKEESSRRLRKLSWTPYFTDGTPAGLAGLFNPLGLFYIVASALPSTLGANAGLLSLPAMMRKWPRRFRRDDG